MTSHPQEAEAGAGVLAWAPLVLQTYPAVNLVNGEITHDQNDGLASGHDDSGSGPYPDLVRSLYLSCDCGHANHDIFHVPPVVVVHIVPAAPFLFAHPVLAVLRDAVPHAPFFLPFLPPPFVDLAHVACASLPPFVALPLLRLLSVCAKSLATPSRVPPA